MTDPDSDIAGDAILEELFVCRERIVDTIAGVQLRHGPVDVGPLSLLPLLLDAARELRPLL